MASAAAASVVDQRMLVELIGYSVLSAVASEAVAWWLIYSKPRYEKLSETFKKVSKRLEKKKEEPVLLKAGKKDKKLLMLEREFEVANRDLMAIKSRSGMVTAIIHIATFFWLKSHYDGHAIARLPFEPFRFLQNVSHRNVPGSNARDASMVFIYMLCSMCIKPNLQRALGHAPPKTVTPAAAQKLAEKLTGYKADS